MAPSGARPGGSWAEAFFASPGERVLGVDDLLSVVFLAVGIVLCFLPRSLGQRLPTAMVITCSALMAYQLLTGDQKMFGEIGLGSMMQGVAFVADLFGKGVWPLMLVLVLAFGAAARYSQFLALAFSSFQVGWLLSTPVFQFLSVEFLWIGFQPDKVLVRQIIFLVMALGLTAIAFAMDAGWVVIMSPLMGAYLTVAGVNHIIGDDAPSLRHPERTDGGCFWPDTYFAGYASHTCGRELVEWLTLLVLGIAVQMLWGQRLLRSMSQEELDAFYEELPSDCESTASFESQPFDRRRERMKKAKKAFRRTASNMKRAWRMTAYFTLGIYQPGPKAKKTKHDATTQRRIHAQGLGR